MIKYSFTKNYIFFQYSFEGGVVQYRLPTSLAPPLDISNVNGLD